jgi:hypothetical protein
VGLIDAADNFAVGQHVKVIIIPLAGWPTKRRAFQKQGLSGRRYRHLSLPQSSSASRFTAGAFGFFIFSQSRDRPDR